MFEKQSWFFREIWSPGKADYGELRCVSSRGRLEVGQVRNWNCTKGRQTLANPLSLRFGSWGMTVTTKLAIQNRIIARRRRLLQAVDRFHCRSYSELACVSHLWIRMSHSVRPWLKNWSTIAEPEGIPKLGSSPLLARLLGLFLVDLTVLTSPFRSSQAELMADVEASALPCGSRWQMRVQTNTYNCLLVVHPW